MNKFNAADFFTSSDETDFLGKGSYASVRRCYHKELGNVVVKCFNLTGSDIAMKRNFTEISREAEVLCRLKHENIINLFGLTDWSTCFGFVMEEATGYNLEDLVLHEEDKFIPWQMRLQFFKEIAEGLNYLHYSNPKRSYIHGDLKLQNILLSDNLKVKIADFGAVNIIQASGASTGSLNFTPGKQHTWLYSSPEFLKNPDTKRTCAMDVYSYALMGYEIITRKQAFMSSRTASFNLIRELIIDNGQKPDEKLFNHMPEGFCDSNERQIFSTLKKVVINCWCFEPNDRMSIKDVKHLLKSKMFNGFDQTKCERLQKPKPSQSSEIKTVTLEAFEYPFQKTVAKKLMKKKNLKDFFSTFLRPSRKSRHSPILVPRTSNHTYIHKGKSRVVNVEYDPPAVSDEPSRSSKHGDSSLYDVQQPTTSSRDNTDHNDGLNQPSTSNDFDDSSFSSTTPQNSSHTELMWKICDRLCFSKDNFLSMENVFFLLVWFEYLRLNENFKEFRRTREERIQELFRQLVEDHEGGKLDDFPQRFFNFLKKER